MKELKTYLLRDVGYDADRRGQLWEITGHNLMGAIRQLDGFARAAFAEPIAPRASTYAVYVAAQGRHAGECATKVGCVRDETPPR